MRTLSTYLETHEITQQAFADLIGVSQPTVSGYLSGEQKPRLKNLLRIAEKTGIDLAVLVREAEEVFEARKASKTLAA